MLQKLLKETAAFLLSFIPSGVRFGPRLRSQLARLMSNFAFEAVLLRKGQGGVIEIYMTLRSKQERDYPGMYHAPGTKADGSDFKNNLSDPFDSMFQRLNRNEFGGALVNYVLVGECYSISEWDQSGVMHRVYLVKASCDPQGENGGWYTVEDLPKNTVPSHYDIVKMAVAAFKAAEGGE